eukprot:COSAG04_NODE_14271_length_574_cov_6.924211_1_plen_22_part_10
MPSICATLSSTASTELTPRACN